MSTQSSTERPRIGEMLVEEGLITQAQLDEALKMQRDKGGKVVENLIALHHIDTRSFLNFLSRQPGTASINLLNYAIPDEIIQLVPAEFALKHELLPIDKLGRDLTVGMACPLDKATIGKLEEMTKLRVRPLLVSFNDIRVALDRYYKPREKTTFSMHPQMFRYDDPKRPKDAPIAAPLGGTGMAPGAAPSHEAPAAAAPSSKTEPAIALAESGLRFEGVVHVVRQIHSLPALPETVAHVRAAMENPETTTNDVAKIVLRDPGLAAKVLSMANSAAYGFSHHVDSVDLAVTLLGLRETYNVVLSSAVIDYFNNSNHFDYKAFWRRSMFCATGAKIIARFCERKSLNGIFTAGLLHDIGRAALAEVASERYAEIDQRWSDDEIIVREQELFGVAHPEVGYILADAWDLPSEITEPIRFHHDPNSAQKSQDLVAIVALAALMTDAYGKISRENVRAFAAECKELLGKLNLTEKQFIAILGETAAAIKREVDKP